MSTMIRLVGATLVALHGVIHLIGFVVPWRIATVDGFPYRATAFGGLAELGDVGMRVVGVAWLVCAVGFVVAGVGIARRSPWARRLTVSLAAMSIVLCVLGLPESSVGILVNATIIAVAAWTAREHPRHVAVPS
jgi:energy-converting hydrogenase Eha subunit E